MAYRGAILGERGVEFSAELWLHALTSLFESFSPLVLAALLGRLPYFRYFAWRNARYFARHSAYWSRVGVGKRRGGALPLRGARQHIPPATRRSKRFCLPLPVCGLHLRFRAVPHAHPWSALRPKPPCLL